MASPSMADRSALTRLGSLLGTGPVRDTGGAHQGAVEEDSTVGAEGVVEEVGVASHEEVENGDMAAAAMRTEVVAILLTEDTTTETGHREAARTETTTTAMVMMPAGKASGSNSTPASLGRDPFHPSPPLHAPAAKIPVPNPRLADAQYLIFFSVETDHVDMNSPGEARRGWGSGVLASFPRCESHPFQSVLAPP